jgi:hypothetical protein
MTNVDLKYGEVTTEFGNFIDGEPVIVFRARDGLTLPLLHRYKMMCLQEESPIHHIEAIEETISRFSAWQEDNMNEVRIPRSDDYAKRVGKL